MQLINVFISEVLGHGSSSKYNHLPETSFFSSKTSRKSLNWSFKELVSSIQIGEECSARIAKSNEKQPRYFHL